MVPLAAPQIAWFEGLDDCELVLVDPQAPTGELAAALEPAAAVLVNSHVRVDSPLLAMAPHLRAISTVSVGFDHIDTRVAVERGISVTTTPVLSDAVADLTMALMTMALRRLGEAMRDLSNGVWSNEILGADVRGKLLFLVGFGRIAREVAARALAAKMHVCAYDVRDDLEPMPGVERVASLADGLSRADVVSLHVDLNPTTHHLLDDAAIAMMRPGAVVINTARGGTIDQAALYRALACGQLGAAGLDVLEREPPDPNEPLLSLANVVVLPHIGSATTETRLAMLECAMTNVVACVRGNPCAHVLQL